MPRVLLAILVFGLAFGATWDAASARADEPQDLDELTQMLDAAAQRLTEVAELAARDPRYRTVQEFKDKTQEEFKKKRSPKAEDMVEIIVDASAPAKLRQQARDALLDARVRTLSPYLLERKGSAKPRNVWAKQKVIKHLADDDQTTRELIQELLLKLFPRAGSDPDIATYSARSDKSAHHRKAMAAWKDFLRK